MSNNEKTSSIKSYLLHILDRMSGSMSIGDSANALLVFVILRRLECLFEPYREKVMKLFRQYKDVLDATDMDVKIRKEMGGELDFYILSDGNMRDLLHQGYLQGASGLEHYINCFDSRTATQLKEFGAIEYANKLMYNDRYYFVIDGVASIDLGESVEIMGFEEIASAIISLSANGGLGRMGSYTSSELSYLMAGVLFAEGEKRTLSKLYDPVCGSGNLLRIAQSQFRYPMFVAGQDLDQKMTSLNALLSKTSGHLGYNFVSGDALTMDAFPYVFFDYVVADLPLRNLVTGYFTWDKYKYPFGTPSNHDGTWLFIQHIIAKMNHNGRAIFTCLPSIFMEDHPYCSMVRSWMLENDLIESIIVLPNGVLYPQTSIGLCLCLLNKSKTDERKNRIQIINANSIVQGNKNRRFKLTDRLSDQIINAYTSFAEKDYCHIAENNEFAQYVLKLYQPERDEVGNIVFIKGEKKADPKKTAFVSVPSTEKDVIDYVKRNVLDHLDKESWIDFSSVQKKCIIDIRGPFIKKPKTLPLSVQKTDVKSLFKQINKQIQALSSLDDEPIIVTPQIGGPDTCLLGTVGRFRRTKKTPSVKTNGGQYPILTPDYLRGYISQPEEYTDGIFEEVLVEDGDTLVLLDGDNAGEVFYGKRGCMSRTMTKIELGTNLFIPEYFYYLIKSIEPELRLMAKGITIKHISIADLRSVLLVIPPMVQQISVIRFLKPKIKALDELIPMLGGEARKTLLNYRQALINEAINPNIEN